MVNKIIVIFLLMTSLCYADIDGVAIEDVKDHAKIAHKLNEIIGKINSDMNDRPKKAVLNVLKQHYEVTAMELRVLRSNLSKTRATVGDPTGTVADVKTKFLKLMDTLDSAPTPQHVEVIP